MKTINGNRERVLTYLRSSAPLPSSKQACAHLGLSRGYFNRLLDELQDMGHLRIIGHTQIRKPLPLEFT